MMNPRQLGVKGIRAGREAQGRLKETPGALSTENSVTVNQATRNLDTLDGASKRFAGQEGHRAMMLATNPEESKRTEMWMNMFTRPETWKIGTEYDKVDTMSEDFG